MSTAHESPSQTLVLELQGKIRDCVKGILPLAPVYIILFFWNMAWTISVQGPVMPLYVTSLGISVVGWSTLAMSLSFGAFLFEWVWGTLSDRMDRRYFIIGSMLFLGALIPVYTVKSLVPYLFVLQFLAGSSVVPLVTITRALVSDNAPSGSIGLSLSLWWTFRGFGRMIGPIVGGYVASRWSFESAFYLSSILAIAGALTLLLFARKIRLRENRTKHKAFTMAGSVKQLFRLSSVRKLFIVATLAYAGFSTVNNLLPIYASEEIGMSTVDVGLLFSIIATFGLVFTPIIGWLSDRFGRHLPLMVGLILTSMMFVAFAIVRTSLQLFFVSICISISFSAYAILLVMLSDVAPRTLIGTAMGVFGTFEDLGIMIGSVVYGLVWSSVAPAYAFVASALTMALAVIVLMNLLSKHQIKLGNATQK